MYCDVGYLWPFAPTNVSLWPNQKLLYSIGNYGQTLTCFTISFFSCLLLLGRRKEEGQGQKQRGYKHDGEICRSQSQLSIAIVIVQTTTSYRISQIRRLFASSSSSSPTLFVFSPPPTPPPPSSPGRLHPALYATGFLELIFEIYDASALSYRLV